MPTMSRRELLGALAAAGMTRMANGAATASRPARPLPFFRTRGVVLTPQDLDWPLWPQRAAEAGLTTVALHDPLSPAAVSVFIRSEAGQKFLAQCRRYGLQVEYELHAMQELLPRELFAKNPEMFRMDEQGERTGKFNLCVSSTTALDIAAENAVRIAGVLKPTTGRYFYWGDDGIAWCRCPKCRNLSDSEQSLVVANHLWRALKRVDERAQIAHLAYVNTLEPPRQVRPEPGVFLEFAPIERKYDTPFEAGNPTNQRHLEMLEANLVVFGRDNAQVLEYWLDDSMFSKWKRPAIKLPFDPKVLAADLDTYGSRGLRHVTSFAVYLDADYVRRFGEPPIIGYGRALTAWKPTTKPS